MYCKETDIDTQTRIMLLVIFYSLLISLCRYIQERQCFDASLIREVIRLTFDIFVSAVACKDLPTC